MKNWNITEFISNLTESCRSLDIGDNVEILFKEKLTPIKINGKTREELKIVKGSYCIYEMEEYEYFSTENRVEMLAIEEYSDSPYSIYINEAGVVESYEDECINTIELGDEILLNIQNKKVTTYSITKSKGE